MLEKDDGNEPNGSCPVGCLVCPPGDSDAERDSAVALSVGSIVHVVGSSKGVILRGNFRRTFHEALMRL